MASLFIILTGLTMTKFSEKKCLSPLDKCIHGFMSNLIKKSWTVSMAQYSGSKTTNIRCALLKHVFGTLFYLT